MAVPQWVQVDLGSTKTTGFLGYLPPYIAGSAFNSSNGHCSGTPCALADSIGLVTSYEIDVSTNGSTFTKVASGTWPADGKMHGVDFPPTPARYIRFIALTVNSGNAAANEIVVGGPQTLTLPAPSPVDFGH